tara:strand:+ start:8787 stop:8954 length:168 start_codon:yes stop_codon:yes gene_type:complete
MYEDMHDRHVDIELTFRLTGRAPGLQQLHLMPQVGKICLRNLDHLVVFFFIYACQ